jgi:hypothetical protein
MQSDLRKEIKFSTNHKSNFFINKNIIKKNNLTKLFPDREIRSIYFDNNLLSNANDNLIGMSNRKKYRIRWYNQDLNFNFEIKSKKNDLVKKNIIFIGYFNSQFDINYQEATEYLRKLKLKKICLVKYLRSYFYYDNLRITFDREIEYTSLLSNKNFKKIKTNEQIIEIKYVNYKKKNFKLLHDFPMTRTRNSKYLNALNKLGILYF